MFAVILATILFFLGVSALFTLWIAIIRLSTALKLKAAKKLIGNQGPIIAFFHPQAENLGGGEKVLF